MSPATKSKKKMLPTGFEPVMGFPPVDLKPTAFNLSATEAKVRST